MTCMQAPGRSKPKKSTSDPYLTFWMKPGETELLRLRNQTNAISGLAELVWNSLDADARSVRIEWEENEMHGVEIVRVIDDGHGIAFDEQSTESHAFMTVGDSRKHTETHQSPEGRLLHGRFGKGRLRALALGGVITWETVFQAGPKRKLRYRIRATVGEPTIEVTSPKATDLPSGTTATVTLVSEKGNSLEASEVRRRFAGIFAEHLANYPQVFLTIQGERLEPAQILQARHPLGEHRSEMTQGDELPWRLRCLEWKEPVSESRGRLFLCDGDGVVLTEQEFGLRGAENLTFYLDCTRSREWDEEGALGLRDDAQQVLNDARRVALQFLRSSFGQRVKSLTEELIEQRIFPYSSAPKSAEEAREKELFSRYALLIKQNVGSYDKMNLDNKRLLFKLLKELLHRDPAAIPEVLTGSLRLTHEDKKALQRVAEGTPSPSRS